MSNLKQLRVVFAESIAVKVNAISTLNLEEKELARLKESISVDIRKFTDLLCPQVSREAHKEAQRVGIDLRKLRWQEQPKVDPGRRVFHFEHFHPVAAIRTKCIEAGDAVRILKILKSDTKVVWITKEEDRRLTDQDYRSKRKSPELAYKGAGIEIMKNRT